jgi:fucose permease
VEPLPVNRDQPTAPGALAGARHGLAGFLLSGLLLSSLGALLLAWRYHIEPNFLVIGTLFLLQNLGVIAGCYVGPALLRRKGTAMGLTTGCGLAVAGLALLALFSPPAAVWWRFGGLLLMGAGAGLINTAAFHAILPAYELDPAATLTLGGGIYTLGGLASALIVGSAFFVYTVPSILTFMALLPAFAIGFYARAKLPPPGLRQERGWRELWKDFRSPSAVLFAALLFFQSGNEGALAGWLALFLSERLGMSPSRSLGLLALYWFTLLTGRFLGRWLLPRVRHGRLLTGAVLGPMFACAVLSFTDNLFGAVTGVVLAGCGFALILPLVVEKIGIKFPDFHPGLFNGIFSLGITGGLLAPATLGYLAYWLGVNVVMALPLLGSIMVGVLLLLLALEARLSGPGPLAEEP